jgi:hypothetical protein
MTDRIHLDDADLFRRWRAETDAAMPDEATLAAYAEDRLAPAEAGPVAAWLAAHPGAAEDVAVARTLAALGLPPHDAEAERIAARAEALVGGTQVIAFPRPGRAGPGWREAATWTALAASIALAGWLGFALGTDTWRDLATSDEGAPGIAEVIDPPSGLLGIFADGATT